MLPREVLAEASGQRTKLLLRNNPQNLAAWGYTAMYSTASPGCSMRKMPKPRATGSARIWRSTTATKSRWRHYLACGEAACGMA